MTWRPLYEPTKKETSQLNREFKKKARWLIDEDLGFGVTEFLRQKGWNVKDVSEVGLTGHSDEDVLAYAHRDDRILLTHDSDFLDDRRFPPNRNPGVVILPGGSGNVTSLIRGLLRTQSIVGGYREIYRCAKISVSDDGSMTIISHDRELGTIRKARYRFPKNGPILEWIDSEDD